MGTQVLYNAKLVQREAVEIRMTRKREHPDQPVVGVGGVVIDDGRALLILRGSPPLEGKWSIPGGVLELGETLAEGVRRELAEETGLQVKVLELIEVLERIYPGMPGEKGKPDPSRPRYHFIIVDYLCELQGGTACAGSDAREFAWAREEELLKFNLTPAATRVLRKAFQLVRARTL